MNLNDYQEALNKLQIAPTLANFLKFYSIDTWYRLGFSLPRFTVYENTITENFLYMLLRIDQQEKLPISLFESKNEKANGNDLEIYLKTNKGYIFFPCQAKRLYPDGTYKKISYSSSGQPQVDKLVAYGKKQRAIPLFLLYSGYQEETFIQENATYGCAFIEVGRCSEMIKKKGSVRFEDVIPQHANPVADVLSCCSLEEIMEFFPQSNSMDIKFYNESEVSDEEKWKRVDKSNGRISGTAIAQQSSYIEPPLEGNSTFNAKYRLLIGVAEDTHSMFYIS